jgi:uncharacterized protein (TIGR04255 family)
VVPLEHYLRVYPEVPTELGNIHGSFLLQMIMMPLYPDHQLTLTLGTHPPEKPGKVTILLDLYDVVPMAVENPFEKVQRRLDEAHANIVHTFENTITDASRQLFGVVSDE